MLKPKRKLISLLEDTRKSLTFLDVRLVGGVLLVLALALIPNSVFAVDYSMQKVGSNFTADFGCNTVQADSGVLAIGARGGLTGIDQNASGCGYYKDSNGDHFLTSGYTGACTFSDNGSLISCSDPNQNRFNQSITYDDYIGKNFRSAVKKISTGSLSATGSNFETVSSNSTGDYLSLTFFKMGSYTIPSHLTPSIIYDTGNPPMLYKLGNGMTAFTETEKKTFMDDLYSNTIFEYGSPKNYVDDDLYRELMTEFGYTNDSDWERDDWAFIAVYLPTYSFDYQISHLSFSVSTPLVQGTISGLQFSVWYVGIGNNSSSGYFPKLDYFLLSPTYNKNSLNSTTELISSMRSFTYKCLTTVCSNANNALLSKYNTKHNQDINGWNFASNPASSWFDVFKFGLIFPFSSFFETMTDDRCVDIPIIASWLYNTQSHVCTYWSDNIRSTLTPVFMSLATILLFGFIVSWLKGNSNSFANDLPSENLVVFSKKGGKI